MNPHVVALQLCEPLSMCVSLLPCVALSSTFHDVCAAFEAASATGSAPEEFESVQALHWADESFTKKIRVRLHGAAPSVFEWHRRNSAQPPSSMPAIDDDSVPDMWEWRSVSVCLHGSARFPAPPPPRLSVRSGRDSHVVPVQ